MVLVSAPAVSSVYAVDDLEPLRAEVGYGVLGRRGDLGYDGGRVRVDGRLYTSALSTHPPARLRFAVPQGCRWFRCSVAINDDVAHLRSHATFSVVADGRVLAEAAHVHAGSPPVPLSAHVGDATAIDLIAHTTSWSHCHAVWLDPVFDDPAADHQATGGPAGTITDPLARADLTVVTGLPVVETCIATVGSAGFEGWVDDLLASVRAFGGCPDARLVVFSLDGSAVLEEVAARHRAAVVRCRPRRPLDPTVKAVLYSVGSLVPAERFVCLDADMLVLDDLQPLFAAMDACPPQAVFVAGEGNDHGIPDLRTALDVAYGGGADPPFFSRTGDLARTPLVVNDGLLAGRRSAFLALERAVRDLPDAVRWVDARGDIRWRNQFALNVALAQMGTAVELDPTWNLQLHVQQVEIEADRPRWRGRDVRVLHFSGGAKHRLSEFRDTTRRTATERITSREQARDARPAAVPGKDLGVSAALIDQPWRNADVPDRALTVPTLLSLRERQVLYWLARHHVRGDGRIVDGGSFLGGSTAALAAGLADRADAADPRWDGAIVSYDMFLTEEYMIEHDRAHLPTQRAGESFRPAFEANIAPWARHVTVREGDICALGWTGEPIEVLFLDVVKTWEVNDVVLAQFLPALVPGRSILVQQDELWGYAPWIHLTMELLRGCMTQLDAMENGSVVYLLTGAIPPGVIGARLREDLSDGRKRTLMDSAVERWEGQPRGMVELARVMLLLELDGAEDATRALARVRAQYGGPARFEDAAARVAGYLRAAMIAG